MINLQQFCYEGEDRKSAIGRPWTDNGVTIATDARILVKVSSADFPCEPNETAPKAEAIAHIAAWDHETKSDWLPIPDLPPIKSNDCRKCDGAGVHACECGDEHECAECEGEGHLRLIQPVDIGISRVDAHYLHKIASLPSALIENATARNKAIAFKFSGGCGYIMPIRLEETR